ncbi:putative uncharacterized protein [Clostridium sp. CAG:470]|nr:MAG: hypothetical protein BHW03_06435 [Clostridium sp. 28_17]CDE15124.1 putative uncharacterized protein [Clostridium sp. CAG:470]
MKHMKRYWIVILAIVLTLSLAIALTLSLAGCGEETVVKEENLEELNPLRGNTLEKTHELEGFQFITTYDTGSYDLSRWRITDSKVVNMTAKVSGAPEGATVLIEHVHIDMSLKSTSAQLDGLSQDNMDDSYHGTSQDGFFISEKYPYQNQFAIEGYSKDLIDGWTFVCGEYGTGSVSQKRLTENSLVQDGNVYANKMQVVYDILIKYADEEYYHVVSVLDEFLIPVTDDGVQTEMETEYQ